MKSCFLIYPIKNLITKIDTKKATIEASANRISSLLDNAALYLRTFNKEAPNIAGIAKKNVNSAETDLETPIIKAPIIVAPERDVPGNIAAIIWNKPIIIASDHLNSLSEFTLGSLFLFLFNTSTTINAIPTTIKAIATQVGL